MTGPRPDQEPNGRARSDAAPAPAPEVRRRPDVSVPPAREPDPVWLADERDLDLL